LYHTIWVKVTSSKPIPRNGKKTGHATYRRYDRVSKRVLGFLAAKGLLIVPGIVPLPRIKLTVKDAVHVAQHVEPRILEVLPAAVIHFPDSFQGMEALPAELDEIIRAIREGREHHRDFRGIEYRRMKKWADKKPVA